MDTVLILEALREIVIAWAGGDWGYSSLAQLLGDANAYKIVNLFDARGWA